MHLTLSSRRELDVCYDPSICTCEQHIFTANEIDIALSAFMKTIQIGESSRVERYRHYLMPALTGISI